MTSIIKTIFQFGPLIFGFGFMAPLIAQIIDRAQWSLPFGITPLVAGLTAGGVLGIAAQVRGRWI